MVPLEASGPADRIIRDDARRLDLRTYDMQSLLLAAWYSIWRHNRCLAICVDRCMADGYRMRTNVGLRTGEDAGEDTVIIRRMTDVGRPEFPRVHLSAATATYCSRSFLSPPAAPSLSPAS